MLAVKKRSLDLAHFAQAKNHCMSETSVSQHSTVLRVQRLVFREFFRWCSGRMQRSGPLRMPLEVCPGNRLAEHGGRRRMPEHSTATMQNTRGREYWAQHAHNGMPDMHSQPLGTRQNAGRLLPSFFSNS